MNLIYRLQDITIFQSRCPKKAEWKIGAKKENKGNSAESQLNDALWDKLWCTTQSELFVWALARLHNLHCIAHYAVGTKWLWIIQATRSCLCNMYALGNLLICNTLEEKPLKKIFVQCIPWTVGVKWSRVTHCSMFMELNAGTPSYLLAPQSTFWLIVFCCLFLLAHLQPFSSRPKPVGIRPPKIHWSRRTLTVSSHSAYSHSRRQF